MSARGQATGARDHAAGATQPRLWLIPAPSRPAAVRRRGGNHIADAVAHTAREWARLGVAVGVAPALELGARARDSVGLDPASRAANLRRHLRIDHTALPPPGEPAIFVDDVITTGATVAACTTALSAAGVRVVAVLALTATT